MPRSISLVTGFNAGEVSPELLGRTDLQKYSQALRTLENFIIHPEGGAFRRPGTRFLAEIGDSARRGRLIPFLFSTEKAFLLLFEHLKIRVFADELLVAVPLRTFDQADVDVTSDQITIEDHGWKKNEGGMRLAEDGTLPSPLAEATDYFVKKAETISFAGSDITAGAPATITVMGHGLSDEMGPYEFHTVDGAFPGGQLELRGPRSGVTYFVNVVDADNFRLSLTKGGGSITLTGPFTDNHQLIPTPDYLRDTFRLSLTSGGAAIDLLTTGSAPPDEHQLFHGTPVPAMEIDSPYTEAELPEVRYAQRADQLFLVHENHPVMVLQPVDSTAQAWNFEEFLLIDGPFDAENATDTWADITFSFTGSSARQALSFKSTQGVNDGRGLEAADIGRFIRVRQTISGGQTMLWAVIIGVNSPTTAQVEIIQAAGWAASTTQQPRTWRLGFFRKTNQPRAISFFERRMALAGEPETPETIHASVTNEFERFSPTGEATFRADRTLNADVFDDNALDFFVGSNQFNRILWLAFGRTLIMGTPGGIFPLVASTNNEAVTPTNVNISQATVSGVSDIQALNVGNRVLYIGRGNRRARALRFAFESDDYVADDLTVLANHILGRSLVEAEIGIEEMAYALERDSIVWAVRKDGVLLGLTFVPEQDVFAWHRHILGGSFAGGDAVVESVASIPSIDNTYDSVFVIVKRTINGATVRYVEVFEPSWESGLMEDARFVDSHPVPFSGAASFVLSGLTHLEGETVQVLGNLGVLPDEIVDGAGEVTLSTAVTRAVVGLGYTSKMQTLPLVLPDPEGTSAGKQSRIDHLILNILETVGGEMSGDDVQWDAIYWREGLDPMDVGLPPFTGFRKIAFPGSFVRDKQILLRQSQPLPMQVLALTILGSVGSR